MTQDEVVLRAYVQLKAVADSPLRRVERRDVEDYHEILNDLEFAGFDMSDFRLNWERDSFHNVMYERQVFPGELFRRKIIALLLYFDIKKTSRVELRTPHS